MEINITEKVYYFFDVSQHAVLMNGMSNAMLGMGGLVGSCWVLLLTFKSVFWLWNGITAAAQEIVLEVFKIAFICSIAFNVPFYLDTIMPFVTGFPAWLGGLLSGQDGNQIKQIDSMVLAYIDGWSELVKGLKFSFFDSEVSSIFTGIQALGIYLIAGIPFLLVMSGTMILLKAAVTVVSAIGPLFIAFSIFPQTRQWFWGWVSTLAGFMLTQILFSVVVGLETKFIYSNIIVDGKIDTSLSGNFAMLLCFAAFTLLATELPNYAASIMGGAPTSTTGIKGLIGKGTGIGTAMNAARGTAKMIGKAKGYFGNKIK